MAKADALSDSMTEESHSEGDRSALDMFFKRSERLSEVDQTDSKERRNKHDSLSLKLSKQSDLIKRIGLLRRRRFD